MPSTLDIYIAFALIALNLYGVKRYCDYKKSRRDFEESHQFPGMFIRRGDFFREYKRENREINFILFPFIILLMYVVLRISGVIENPFF